MPEHFFIKKAKATGCDSFWYEEYRETALLDIMNPTMKRKSVYPYETPIIVIGYADSSEQSYTFNLLIISPLYSSPLSDLPEMAPSVL